VKRELYVWKENYTFYKRGAYVERDVLKGDVSAKEPYI